MSSVSGNEFVELLSMLKEKMLNNCSRKIREKHPNRCLRLYNDMKKFFYRLKKMDDPIYIRLYRDNLDPIIRFVLLKNEKNTFRTYFRILYHYAKFLILNKKNIFDVDADLLNRYFTVGLGSEYKESNTLALVSKVIRLFYNHYNKNETVNILRRFKFKEKLKFRVDLTDEEYERIYESIDDLRVKLALELIAGSGLRPSEALGIAWGDVDTSKDPWIVHIRYIPNSRYGAKGEGGEGDVPITRRASKLISILRRIYIEKYAVDPMKSDKYSRIINISYQTLDKKFKRAVKKAGIQKRYPLTLHKLRHYFGHRWMRINKDVVKLKNILRHSNINYTLIYTNPTDEEILESFKEVDRE
jgi:integrase